MRQAYNKAFIVEVRLAGNVVQCNFTKFGCLATKGTWFHNLWEFVFHLKVSLELDPKFHVKPAQVGDIPITEIFVSLALDKKNLNSLNRVQKYKKKYFSSLIWCTVTGLLSQPQEGETMRKDFK